MGSFPETYNDLIGGSMAEWSACWTPGFKSRSGPLLDLFSDILSSNSWPQLKIANWLPPTS